MDKILIVQVAALGYEFFKTCNDTEEWNGLAFKKAESVFPSLTCPVQATMRTALPPSSHGMVMNGIYAENLRRPMFWEQSSALVQGERIWNGTELKTGLLFWQQSLGEDTDVLLSPAPIHTHGGGMAEAVYAKPKGLYDFCANRHKRFKLSSYWGPLASGKSSEWITAATAEIMDMKDIAPDLLFTYIPHLDYPLQKYGPGAEKSKKAFSECMGLLKKLLDACGSSGYDMLIYGDYAIGEVSRAVFPNKLLANEGLFKTRSIRGRLYPDFNYSAAFAVCDHEIAHVYIKNRKETDRITDLFTKADGIGRVLSRNDKNSGYAFHEKAGDLILTAEEGAWCAYPWWHSNRKAPDYATHVDIHNKPGYDPCELFFGWHPFIVSTDTSKIQGSHGRIEQGREAAWASTFPFKDDPQSLLDIAQALKKKIHDE